MKKITMLLISGACMTVINASAIGNDTVTAYGTYWDGEEAGYGLGLKYSKSLIDMIYFEGRGGFVQFDDPVDTTMVPLEVGFNLGLPGPITPYAGVGVGYYFIDHPFIDNASGYYGQIGIEFSIVKIGAMIELRYMDLEEDYFDDLVLNAGILLRF